MSDILYSLEQDFTQYISSINKKISSLSNQSSEKKEAAISEAEYEVKEVEKCIKKMEAETLSLAPAVRTQFSQKIRKYKQDYDEVKKKFKQCEENYLSQKEKEKLMGARFEEEDYEDGIKGNTLMDQQNKKLIEAKKLGYQTVDIATSTANEMYRQTDVLSKNKERLKQIDSDIGESNTIINSMQKRIKKNKLTLFLVLGVVILAVVLIIYSYT